MSNIEWTDTTWNPVIGCTPVSPGCLNCYAATMARRLPNQSKPFPTIANPGNVIRASVGGGAMGDRLCHENEAPFPEALAERFIRSFCPPGGTVLDCFGGSGTVGKVAAMHGRNAVLIDIRGGKGGLDTARRRLEAFNTANPDKAVRIVWPGKVSA